MIIGEPPVSVPYALAPLDIVGEPYVPAIDNYTVYACSTAAMHNMLAMAAYTHIVAIVITP